MEDDAIDEDEIRAKTMGSKFDQQEVDERTSWRFFCSRREWGIPNSG